MEACRSFCRVGSATFRIVEARYVMNKLELQINSTTRRRRRPAGPSGMVTSGAKVASISPLLTLGEIPCRRPLRRARRMIGRHLVRALDDGGGPRRACPPRAARGRPPESAD